MITEQLMVYLIRCALKNETAILPNNCDYERLFSLCELHHVAPIVYYALKKAGYDGEALSKFNMSRSKAVARSIIQQSEFEKIATAFTGEKVEYLAFKGLFISRLYPNADMRVSSDLDFLVATVERNKSRKIMEGLGYTTEDFGKNGADVYFKKPIMNVEIHTTLFENDTFNGYFDSSLGKKVYDELLCAYTMSFADLYIYSLAHFHKHYELAGCGVRFIADHYLLTQNLDKSDYKYVKSELKKLGLFDFKKQMDIVADKWFGKDNKIADWGQTEQYITKSGIYGSERHKADNMLLKYQKKYKSMGKAVYVIRRIFPPLSSMKSAFAAVNKCPFLLPVFWIYRIFRVIFCRNDKIKSEANLYKSMSGEQK